MIRTFHSVGQGAFYTEKFDNFTMVYDCGSKKEYIDKEIKTSFEKDEDVNLLFISHFHEDHINGLDTLLKWCNVEYVALPLLTDESKIELFCESFKSNNHFIDDLIFHPYNTIKSLSPETKVIFVKPFNIRDERETEIKLNDIDDKGHINSGTKILTDKLNPWIFVPSNYEVSNRVHTLTSKLKKLPFTTSSTQEFIKNWSKPSNRKEIKKCFNSLKGNPNQNSMTLYSGANEESVNIDVLNFQTLTGNLGFPFALYLSHHKYPTSGCLYFGDYEAKGSNRWDNIKRVYNRYWNDIDTIQIPHHGSIENYNVEINSRPEIISVISTGTNNRYRHPSSYVTSEIIKNRGYLCNVTEIPLSRVQYVVNKI